MSASRWGRGRGGIFIFAVVIVMVCFQSFSGVMSTWGDSNENDLNRRSISSVVSCFVPREWARQHACPHQKRKKHALTYNASNRRDVGVALLVDEFLGAAARRATIKNKQRYCDRWGYDLIAPDLNSAKKMAGRYPFPWGKFKLLQHALQRHEYVLMLDADAFINNLNFDLSELIAEMTESRAFLLISEDFNGINSGVFMLHNSSTAHSFLQEAIGSAELLAFDPYLPLRFENRAFFYLLNKWPTCFGMRRIDSVLAPQYNSSLSPWFVAGTKVVDRCRINVRPASKNDAITSSSMSFDTWGSETFILHAAGGDFQSKLDFIQSFGAEQV